MVHLIDSEWNPLVVAIQILYEKLVNLGFYLENGGIRLNENPELIDNAQRI